VGDAGLREFANPDGADWAARKITRVIFLAPDDTEVKVAERERRAGCSTARGSMPTWRRRRSPPAPRCSFGTEATGMTRAADGRWHSASNNGAWRTSIERGFVIAPTALRPCGPLAGIDTRVRA